MAERRTASRRKRQNLSKGRANGNRRLTAEKGRVTANGGKRSAHADAQKPIGTTFQSKVQVSSKSSNSSTMSLCPKRQAAERFLDNILELGTRGIRKEWITSVKAYTPSGARLAWRILENKDKNRYEDVDVIDETRVKLRNNVETGKAHDDYIHANYVKVHDDLVYICSQGPLPNTLRHFWLMVVQERSKIILQLCNFYEEQKEKCTEYFPNDSEGNGWKAYGPVEVRAVERQSNIPMMKKVVKTKLQVRYKDETFDVLHILYGGWPDHSVADSVTCYREVYVLIHKLYDKKPIVAHCSAGVGRTGTFVAIEMCLHRILMLNDMKFSVPEVTKELRDQRFKAIQNDQQYVFVFRAVLEILVNDGTLDKSERVLAFIAEYDELVARKRVEPCDIEPLSSEEQPESHKKITRITFTVRKAFNRLHRPNITSTMSNAPEASSQREGPPDVNSAVLNERHPLRRTWTLWFLNDKKNLDWLERLHEVCSVDTLEDFWALMANIRPASRLNNTCDYNVFRDNIRPVWEVAENKRGGRWLINIDRNRHPETVDVIWMELLIAMVGEQFGADSEQICGLVCNIRNKGSKISVWTHDASDEEANRRIGLRIKETLLNADRPEHVPGPVFDTMRYEVHDDVQQKNSSQIRSRLVINSSD
ncbi:hypothetical protein QR680_006420 [Steinernema hermaphroditum]|uniref:eIF-4F 25 kDa subunit n=1 Tax=Steinernema hermaphroditum TaxID=289476 RepID=A0AA39LXD9_9BILA|nr:hypothetical protein QR680_006420 [Steinernema hermaphroditum]